LTDWDSGSDSDVDIGGTSTSKSAATASIATVRQVCLRRMFTLAELDEDPSLLLDLKDDVREECETLGKVTNVVLWDVSGIDISRRMPD
jgi:HIV Tat-specific factor 1